MTTLAHTVKCDNMHAAYTCTEISNRGGGGGGGVLPSVSALACHLIMRLCLIDCIIKTDLTM